MPLVDTSKLYRASSALDPVPVCCGCEKAKGQPHEEWCPVKLLEGARYALDYAVTTEDSCDWETVTGTEDEIANHLWSTYGMRALDFILEGRVSLPTVRTAPELDEHVTEFLIDRVAEKRKADEGAKAEKEAADRASRRRASYHRTLRELVRLKDDLRPEAYARKLEALKAEYPELYGTAPAEAPAEIRNT